MKVAEIFQSIDGEVNYWGQGTQSTFIRLGGCNLRCTYCDTKRTQDPENTYEEVSVANILRQIETEKVTITGGEPLLQLEELNHLILNLITEGKKISIETNGTIIIPKYLFDNSNISMVIDFKIPYLGLMEFQNFRKLRSQDFIKFPIENGNQFEIAVSYAKMLHSTSPVRITFSAVGFTQTVLLEWLQKLKLDYIVFNVQLHKLLNLR